MPDVIRTRPRTTIIWSPLLLSRFNQKTTGHHMHFPESSGMLIFPGVDACRFSSAGAVLSIVLFDRTCDEPPSALPARRYGVTHRRRFQADP
jgi:hypothetical protein